MAYFEIPENPDYNDKIEKLTPETRGHADVWNVIYERIIQNIAYIHNAVNVLKGSGDGSVTKLIAEEVAKIIADAPEDFDTLKEISDWISKHKDSAAAMNADINKLEEGKLDKTAIAAKSETLKVPRVSEDLNTLPGLCTGTIKEHLGTSANIPTNQYYHVITLEGADAGYTTQLAIGMTTTAMYYRNRQNGTWGEWKEVLLLSENKVKRDCIVMPRTVIESTDGKTGVELTCDKEGGNIVWYSPKGVRWEIDCFDEHLRIFNYETFKNFRVGKDGKVWCPNDTDVAGSLTVHNAIKTDGEKVKIWSDNEGGNIEITSDTGASSWQMDAVNDIFRIYKRNNSTNKNHNPIRLIDDTTEINSLKVLNKSQLSEMAVYGSNNIFYIGGVTAQANGYPHLKTTQFSNSLQILPTQTKTCTIGHQSIPFESVAATNIYNSSGLITSSDRNKKKDFADIMAEFAEQIIDGLIPTSFKYKDGGSGRTHYGLVAQDVEELLEELGVDSKDFAPLIKEYPKKEIKNKDGSISIETDYDAEPEYFLRYEGFTGLIIKYIQGLKQEIKSLKDVVSTL